MRVRFRGGGEKRGRGRQKRREEREEAEEEEERWGGGGGGEGDDARVWKERRRRVLWREGEKRGEEDEEEEEEERNALRCFSKERALQISMGISRRGGVLHWRETEWTVGGEGRRRREEGVRETRRIYYVHLVHHVIREPSKAIRWGTSLDGP